MLSLVLALAPLVPPGDSEDFARDVRPLLAEYCAKCHSGPDSEGSFAIDGFLDGTRALADAATWREVKRQLAQRKMPPKKEPRPPQAVLEPALRWIEQELARHDARLDPGRPTLRRLNRREYENSVRALVGVHFAADEIFPADDAGFGFDNIGDVLSISDTLFEKYVIAAERIAEAAVDVPDPEHPPATRIADERVVHTEKFATHGGSWSLFSNGFVGVDFEFPRDGEYVLRARAFGQQAGDAPARMVFKLDEREVARFDVVATQAAPELYQQRLQVSRGKQRFTAWFVNDFWNPDEPDRSKRDRNLLVEWLEIAGPVGAALESDFQRRMLPREQPWNPRQVLEQLAERAWRRPLAHGELERLESIAPRGAQPAEVVRDGLIAILSSPHFLFRIESDPPSAEPGSVRDLDGYELATRLSYFLWSSLPDEELGELARTGQLLDDATLEAQLRRMLRDARSSELVANFAAQWLQLRALERIAPDRTKFPDFDEDLRAAMRAETEMLFEAVLREDRTVAELIDPSFTFLNERLAKHYAIEGVRGPQMRRVALDATQRETRGGLLQQASVLAVTSNPTRTSPVKRGRWVLETLLGVPPIAPQPGVDSLDDSKRFARSASLRERLEQHRADPKCAVCHDALDPLGFALENYDSVGRWRTQDDGHPVDASGAFEDGTAFDGPLLLERRIAGDPAFVRGLLEKLAVYALGRGMRPQDAVWLDELAHGFRERPATLARMIEAVVCSDAFRRRVVAEKP